MTAKLQSAIKATEKLTRGVGDFRDKDINFRVGVKGLQQLERYRSILKESGMTQPKTVNLNLRDNGATSKIGKIRADLQGIASKAWTATLNVKTNGAAALGKVKNNLSELATGAAFGLGAGMLGTAGVGYGLVSGAKSYMDFEKEMSAVQAVIGYDKSQMGALQAEAERIGYETKFTAAEGAKAMYYQAMAGWKEEQILSGTQGIVNLAAAGDMDLARASDVVTDLMTAYGLKAGSNIKLNGKPLQEASAFFVDSMAALVTNANTDVEQAFEAMKYSAPAISAMYADKSIEEKAQAMQDAFIITGLMASGGVKGSMAGTSQRSLFTRLSSENRNAYFAERALPVSLVDETTGEVRRLRDVVKDFRDKFQNGLDVDQVTDFAEAISGEKIHADTRRKLNSFIENVQKNGGKMTGADKLKLTSMLAGQEAMSGWLNVFLASEEDWNKLAASIDNAQGKADEMRKIRMDNLAGDIALLGSAWDAFQRGIMTGAGAGEGLRNFTQGLTDVLTTANNLFKDGIQFTDWFAILGAGIDKLKNKFLEFDGIGSILAGGALFMGLKKIASLALSVKDTLSTWSKARTLGDVGDILRGNKTPPISSSQVGTMHVSAGVVNVNGAVKGGTAGTSTVGGTSARTRSQQYADDYYRRREQILAGTSTGGTTSSTSSTRAGLFKGAGGAMAGAGALAAVFGALDIYSAHKQSKISNDAAAQEVANARKALNDLMQSGDARQEDINFHMQAVENALAAQKEIAIQNANAERKAEFGAGGALAGAMAGAALGMAIPVIGPMIGAMIGGALGQFAGDKAADSYNNTVADMRENKNDIPSIQAGSVAEFRGVDTGTLNAYKESLTPENQALQVDNSLSKYADSMARHQAVDRAEMKNAKIIDNDLKLEAARQNLHSAGYQYELMRQRAQENAAVANRENYYANERAKQQKMFGGMFAGEITPYQAKGREAAALQAYDNRKAAEMRESNIKQAEAIRQDAMKNARDLSGQYEQSARALQDQRNTATELAARQKSFSDAFTNNDGEGFFDSIKNFFSGAGMAALDMMSSKADAATPDSINQPVQSQGVTDFELPNFAEMFSNFELPELGIAEKIQAEFEGATAIFDNFVMTAQTSFTNLGTGIQGALEGAKSYITTAFNDAATQVQATWNAMPGFFSGVFSGLGGAASAAGSAIYSGLTSVIGGIIGAWQSAAATISGIISSISAGASSIAGGIGGALGIGSNATGTASWRGGWTEINEHGGEIINLPKGTQIIPHATTKKILRNEIHQSIERGDDNYRGLKFADYGLNNYLDNDVIKPSIDVNDGFRKNKIFTRDTLGRIFKRNDTQPPLSGDVIKPNIDFNDGFRKNGNFTRDIIGRIFKRQDSPLAGDVITSTFDLPTFDLPTFDLPSTSTSSSNTTNNQSSSNTLNINGVTIQTGADEDSIFFHLQQMISLAMANSEFA